MLKEPTSFVVHEAFLPTGKLKPWPVRHHFNEKIQRSIYTFRDLKKMLLVNPENHTPSTLFGTPSIIYKNLWLMQKYVFVFVLSILADVKTELMLISKCLFRFEESDKDIKVHRQRPTISSGWKGDKTQRGNDCLLHEL